MIKSYITEVAIYDDDDGRTVAKITAADECCVKIEIASIQTLESWKELSKEIELAIEKMDFK